MDKKTYYVSVQASTVLEQKEDAAYEFEIEATDEEISLLQELFDDQYNSDNQTYQRANSPFKEYNYDKENDQYGGNLTEVYKMLYRLGKPETKSHIEQMGILNEEHPVRIGAEGSLDGKH